MRVAVVGLGWWGKQIISCLKNSPRFAVVQGVDPAVSEDVKTFLSESRGALPFRSRRCPVER